MRRVLPFAVGLAWLALAAGCGTSRGTKGMGDPCSSSQECSEGVCVGGVHGDAPACTRSCARTEECPRGWACSGVTEGNLLVCSFGAPTPFGIGARE
jgi:hypothetical protein